MSYGIKLHVWGDFALFTRPEMKTERVSYDVMTPSAARGMLQAIYWKPEIEWIIQSIDVLKPIKFTNIRRNEVGALAVAPSRQVMNGKPGNVGLYVEDERQQRAAMLLKDVSYVISAKFEVLECRMERGGPLVPIRDCEAKHLSIFNRKARAGQYRHHPYFGCREFPVNFALIEEGYPYPESLLPIEQLNQRLGWMLHDVAYIPDPKGNIIESNRNQRVRAEHRFFDANMVNGIIDVPPFRQARA